MWLLLAVTLSQSEVCAQVKWLKTDYDFGIIRETDGPVEGEVRFVNMGDSSLYVNRVRPSCGCTGASYTETMINPGDTAFVKFIYDPKGRPGKFEKTIKVYLGLNNDLTTLTIHGTVIGSDETLRSVFPITAGPLRLERNKLTVGELRQGVSRHFFVMAYNQGTDTITPQWSGGGRVVVTDLTPREIAPGEWSTISFYIRGEAEKQLGPAEYVVKIKPESGSDSVVNVSINALIVADSRKMSVAEIDNSPQAFILPEYVDLGEVEPGRKMKFEFELLNEGGSTLRVDKVTVPKTIKIKGKPTYLKKDHRGKVKGVVDIGMLPDGPFRLEVNVYTNDVLHPVRTARIVGEVKR